MPVSDDDFDGFISRFRNDYNSAENVLGQLGIDEDEVKKKYKNYRCTPDYFIECVFKLYTQF